MVIAMIGPTSSRAPRIAASNGLESIMQMALHIFNDDDRIIDDQADGKHDREERQEIDREPEQQASGMRRR